MKANTKNSSAKKKLIPAVGMLTISAVMLASSTYAWFTMSREVEVTGINMTATVPEDLQISLGAIYKADNTAIATESDNLSLANSTGTIYGSDGTAAAPQNSWDWSNSADISKYYEFGKIMPASSTDGATIYYTADATGTGRTVNAVAKYFAANSALDAFQSGGTAKATAGQDVARTSLHAITAKDGAAKASGDTWKTATYAKATSWDDTNDDGYYVDIPVWLRSSATEDINIKVAGYVLPGSTKEGGSTETELELYKSVRVAILNGDANGIKSGTSYATVTAGSVTTTNNILPLVDAWDKTNSTHTGTGDAAKYTAITGISNPFVATTDNPSILDSGIYIERTAEPEGLWGVKELKAYTDTDATNDKTGHIQAGDNGATYDKYTAYDGSTAIATVKANTTSDDYGEMKKLIIRVWLDGEDEECWNDNAGQDWAISLKFSKID